MKTPVKVVLVGAGSRGMQYTEYALKYPEEMTIEAVVDTSEARLKKSKEHFSLSDDRLFKSVENFLKSGVKVDAAVNTTMDELHVPLSIPLLEAGLSLLVEKPISLNEEDLLLLSDTAKKHGCKVMVCHVLRYTPFYNSIKQSILDGEIGEIKAIQTEENVSFHHLSASFIRGKWAKLSECGSKMLMAKCCHDLDMITWLKSGIPANKVASFGHVVQYKSENAPKGSGKRCLCDCKIEETCPYSAKLNYVDCDLWHYYVWQMMEDNLGRPLTDEEKIKSLKEDNPFGRCVWHCGADTEDVQSVIIDFADGCVATHNLYGGVPKPCRTIHIVGTLGEIYGVFEEGWYEIRKPDLKIGKQPEYSVKKIEINESLEGHGGGDKRLPADFVSAVRGEPVSISYTGIEDSVTGHRIGFAAQKSLETGSVIVL